MNRAVLVAAIAIAVFVLSAAGFWTRGVVEKRVEDRQVVELLRDTTGQLRVALAPRAPANIVARLEQNLQAAKAPRDPQLGEAAELYIVSAREIARRRVDAERLERQAAANRAALEAHMARGTRRRNEGWFRGALELKKNVERDHSELNRTLKALDDLLETLPEAEKKLAPHVAQTVLLEDAERVAARRQAQAELKRADAQLQRARNLAFR
jgi:hypothetical protein